jgi:hypothetical protein
MKNTGKVELLLVYRELLFHVDSLQSCVGTEVTVTTIVDVWVMVVVVRK